MHSIEYKFRHRGVAITHALDFFYVVTMGILSITLTILSNFIDPLVFHSTEPGLFNISRAVWVDSTATGLAAREKCFITGIFWPIARFTINAEISAMPRNNFQIYTAAWITEPNRTVQAVHF